MIEKEYKLYKGDEKTIEKVLLDENLHYLHIALTNGDELPEHFSNSNVYMTVIRGKLSIGLNEQDIHVYEAGTLLQIPNNTRMCIMNKHLDTLELIVVKAPAPKS